MKLEITNQTNEQECGVCVLTSLHNYFYSDKLEKEQVLDKSNITHNGMNIFDFETLGKQLGIDCESYEIQWSEFMDLRINNYFVALVATTTSDVNHYVIVKKCKKEIIIYDSCSIEIKHLNYEQFKKMFLNVLILVNKKPNKTFSKVFGNTRTLLLFDLKFILLNLLLSILILGTSILAASYLNWIIDSSISKSSINNLITISFVFVFVYFSNDLLTYISNLYISSQMKNYYLLFTNKILASIEYKNTDFLYKVDKNWIYKVDECVYSISNFCVLEINKLITNIIFTIICICIIGSIQAYLLIFIIFFALAELIPFLFAYRKKRELFSQVVRVENKNAQYYKNLIQSLSFETWHNKRKSLISSIKNNYSKIYKNFSDATIFRSNNYLVKSLSKSFLDICLIACTSYLVIKNQNLSIGKLTFVIAAFNLFKNSCGDIFNYFLVKIEFNVYWQVYKDLTNVSNLQDKEITLQDIKSIEFIKDNQVFILETGKKVNQLILSIHDLIDQSHVIKFNNTPIYKNNKKFFENIIVVDQFTVASKDMLLTLLEQQPELYAGYLRKFKIELNLQQLSFDQNHIINLLCLLQEKNKIIIIDSILNYIKDQETLKEILNKIRTNNNLFIAERTAND